MTEDYKKSLKKLWAQNTIDRREAFNLTQKEGYGLNYSSKKRMRSDIETPLSVFINGQITKKNLAFSRMVMEFWQLDNYMFNRNLVNAGYSTIERSLLLSDYYIKFYHQPVLRSSRLEDFCVNKENWTLRMNPLSAIFNNNQNLSKCKNSSFEQKATSAENDNQNEQNKSNAVKNKLLEIETENENGKFTNDNDDSSSSECGF